MKLSTFFTLLTFAVSPSLWKAAEAACNELGIGASLVMYLSINLHVLPNNSRISRWRRVYVDDLQIESNPPGECDIDVNVAYRYWRRRRSDTHYNMVARFTYEWADDYADGSFCITDVTWVSGDTNYLDRVRDVILVKNDPCLARRRRALRGEAETDVVAKLLEGENFLNDTASAIAHAKAVAADFNGKEGDALRHAIAALDGKEGGDEE